MNEDSLPNMKTLFGCPLPALSPSDGESVASGRVRGIFTLEDRLRYGSSSPQSSALLLQRGHFDKFRNWVMHFIPLALFETRISRIFTNQIGVNPCNPCQTRDEGNQVHSPIQKFPTRSFL